MVRAHRGIVSKLSKGHRLFRLCFDPAKSLSHPTFMPQIADWFAGTAGTALYRNGDGGNSQPSLLKIHMWTAPACEGCRVQFRRNGRVQSYVRPVGAVPMTAGPDGSLLIGSLSRLRAALP
jgi:hypothetical protein